MLKASIKWGDKYIESYCPIGDDFYKTEMPVYFDAETVTAYVKKITKSIKMYQEMSKVIKNPKLFEENYSTIEIKYIEGDTL